MIPWHIRSWQNAVQYQQPEYSEPSVLDSNYQSLLDPRLNRAQALEISLFISQEITNKGSSSFQLTGSGI